MLKGWQITKINASKEKKPYKQMKDRDMSYIKVVFKKSKPIQDETYYYFDYILQTSNEITIQYIANLGMGHIHREYTHRGGGGYFENLTLDENQFNRMKSEVERLGGKVIIKED